VRFSWQFVRERRAGRRALALIVSVPIAYGLLGYSYVSSWFVLAAIAVGAIGLLISAWPSKAT
jgi:hypothetical protein